MDALVDGFHATISGAVVRGGRNNDEISKMILNDYECSSIC